MEKRKIFTEMTFDNVQFAMDTKQKSEEKLNKCKKGLILAAAAQVCWVIMFYVFNNTKHLEDVFSPSIVDAVGIPILLFALAAAIAAYIIGGGIGNIIKFTLTIAKTLLVLGWVLLPIPANIFSGIFLSIIAVLFLPFGFFCLPLLFVFMNYIQCKKDYQAAEDYLKYCH